MSNETLIPASTQVAPKVGFVSLGCPKALVDSEQILTQLRAEGYETAKSYDGADLVVDVETQSADAAAADPGSMVVTEDAALTPDPPTDASRPLA